MHLTMVFLFLLQLSSLSIKSSGPGGSFGFPDSIVPTYLFAADDASSNTEWVFRSFMFTKFSLTLHCRSCSRRARVPETNSLTSDSLSGLISPVGSSASEQVCENSRVSSQVLLGLQIDNLRVFNLRPTQNLPRQSAAQF